MICRNPLDREKKGWVKDHRSDHAERLPSSFKKTPAFSFPLEKKKGGKEKKRIESLFLLPPDNLRADAEVRKISLYQRRERANWVHMYVCTLIGQLSPPELPACLLLCHSRKRRRLVLGMRFRRTQSHTSCRRQYWADRWASRGGGDGRGVSFWWPFCKKAHPLQELRPGATPCCGQYRLWGCFGALWLWGMSLNSKPWQHQSWRRLRL